ncbi:hypothetical protein CAL14_19650 [Bordetella genomosp. 9]|uniref:acyltransferase family protein n=1 Tax=Bordetella genomosp. 9 TaxID=1416803 RepID=UPI000A28EDD9|nr:acyltransferase [Bordetella genomosp. 9]ARP92223.1 hypothetical protein CAL14_19650 [Bordetella genomosp. 9]
MTTAIPTVAGRQKIEILQLLRGVAALMVVVFHARTYVSELSPNEPLRWVTDPFSTGIDLFFVISGFVMVYTTQSEQSRKPSDFFVKRLSRIVPAYIVATVLYVVSMRIMEHLTGYRGLYDHFKPRDVLKSIAFIPINLSGPKESPFFGGASLHVGWTLNYEVYFYLVFFGSLFFRRYRWAAFTCWMALIMVALPHFLGGGVSFDIGHFYGWRLPYFNLMTSCLIWEFIMGVVIGHIYLRDIRFPDAISAWLATIVAITFALWAVYSGAAAKLGQLGYGACYAILISILLAADKAIGFRIPAPLVWLGDVSFSLYLIHPTIIENIAIPLLGWPDLRPALTGFTYVLFLSALSLCAAHLFHVSLERRLATACRARMMDKLRTRPAQGRAAVTDTVL